MEKDPREGEKSVSVTVFQLNAALRPQRPQGLLGTGSEGRPPIFTQLLSSEACQ